MIILVEFVDEVPLEKQKQQRYKRSPPRGFGEQFRSGDLMRYGDEEDES